MPNKHDEPKPLQVCWWILRTVLISLVAWFFISTAFGPHARGWAAGSIVLVLTGAVILYVEVWSWWNRIAGAGRR